MRDRIDRQSAGTQAPFETGKSNGFSTILPVATRRLPPLGAAQTLEFLRSSRGNCLEAWTADRNERASIRANDQCRLILNGRLKIPPTLRSWTSIEGRRDP